MTAPAIDPGDNHRLSISELEQRVRDQIEYDFLVTDSNRQELDEIVSIIVEVLAMHGEGFEVGGLLKPPDLVMKNFLALNSEHLEYVFACLDRTRSNVRNIRQYLRVALYNAPMTMYSSTAAEVRRDFGFSSFRRRSGYSKVWRTGFAVQPCLNDTRRCTLATAEKSHSHASF